MHTSELDAQTQELAALTRGPRPQITIRELNPPAKPEEIPLLREGHRLLPAGQLHAVYEEYAGPARRIQIPEGRVDIKVGRTPAECEFQIPRPGPEQFGGVVEVYNLTPRSHVLTLSRGGFGPYGNVPVMHLETPGANMPIFNGTHGILALRGLGSNVRLYAHETGCWVILGGHQYELR